MRSPTRTERPITARRGYTLVELFLTLAVVMMVFGLMINLGGRVRREATERLTRRTLHQIAAAMDRYLAEHDNVPPAVPPLLVPGAKTDDATLLAAARANNAAVVRLLNYPTPDGHLTDPWGSPIVFMPGQNPLIGLDLDNHPFFLSAGPDRRYTTREDNLYSYDEDPAGRWTLRTLNQE